MKVGMEPGITVKGRQQKHRHQDPGTRFGITYAQIPQSRRQQQRRQDPVSYTHLLFNIFRSSGVSFGALFIEIIPFLSIRANRRGRAALR